MSLVARFYATFSPRQAQLRFRLFQRRNTGSCNIPGVGLSLGLGVRLRVTNFGQPRGRRPSTICNLIFNKKLLHIKRKDLAWILLQNCKTWKSKLYVNLQTWRNLLPNKTHGLLMLLTGSFAARTSLNIIHCERLKLSHKSRISPQDVNQVSEKTNHKDGTESSFDWKLFFNVLWPDMWLFALASLSAFAAAIVNIQIPLLLGKLINAISSLNRESNELTDVFDVLYEPSIKLLINYGMQSVLTFTYISLLSSFGERFAARLRTKLFSSLICQDVAFFDVHKTGELVNRLTTDVQDFKSSFKQCISQGLKSITQSIGCIITMYAVSPKLTMVMLIVVPGIVFGGALIGSLLRRLSTSAQEQVAVATAVADEALGNIRVVRSFAMEGKETSWYSKEIYKSQYLNELLGMGIGVFQGLSNLAINSMVLVVLYSGGILLDSREVSAGELMSFLVSMQTIQRSLGVLSILYGQVLRGLSAGVRVFEYINVVPTIPVQGGQMIPIGDVKGHIEFKNVCFRYPCRPEYSVLEDLNLTAESGKMVALCGPSGSGKSTIAALIERFYDAQSGSIEIDGVDIKELDPAWLRGQLVGFISQEPVLFATSIKENIRYGKPDATDAEVYEAAITANADNFIREFPNGYNTVLGERGVTVSGGQKQRIAIARALLKDPQILILDEATSALDAESERIVQEALDRATKGRTVLVIAHRLSTIKNADLIAVLSDGLIKELGTHEELIRKRGLYAELVKRQTDKKQDTQTLSKELNK